MSNSTKIVAVIVVVGCLAAFALVSISGISSAAQASSATPVTGTATATSGFPAASFTPQQLKDLKSATPVPPTKTPTSNLTQTSQAYKTELAATFASAIEGSVAAHYTETARRPTASATVTPSPSATIDPAVLLIAVHDAQTQTAEAQATTDQVVRDSLTQTAQAQATMDKIVNDRVVQVLASATALSATNQPKIIIITATPPTSAVSPTLIPTVISTDQPPAVGGAVLTLTGSGYGNQTVRFAILKEVSDSAVVSYDLAGTGLILHARLMVNFATKKVLEYTEDGASLEKDLGEVRCTRVVTSTGYMASVHFTLYGSVYDFILG